jgi:tRNA wybutosine-synthesizing protein 3
MICTEELFLSKKDTILKALAVPDETYSDLSPKGSVDVGIKDLIALINSLDGVVTTSSCAGRISVFQEGDKTQVECSDEAPSFPATGGKGKGGRWLFVSHDPVLQGEGSFTEAFHLGQSSDDLATLTPHIPRLNASTRFIRLQFEPMVVKPITSMVSIG